MPELVLKQAEAAWGLVLKKSPQRNSWCYSDLSIYSSFPGGPTCLKFRRDGTLGGSKTSPHSHCFIRALCLNKSPGTREWWVCLLLCLRCLWLGLGTRWNVKLQEEREEETGFEVWERGCGIAPGKQLDSGTPVPALAEWASAVREEPESDQSFCLNGELGRLGSREECLKRSPEGTFSERQLWGLALSEQGKLGRVESFLCELQQLRGKSLFRKTSAALW